MVEHWDAPLVSTRAALMRVARTRLRNDDWAADAVGAVMLSALEQPPPFDEPGRVRAWLFGMLRHKLVDVLREQAPLRLQSYGLDPDPMGPAETGGAPTDTAAGPEAQVAGRRFLEDLALALEQLPSLHKRAFLLREVLGEETEHACKALGITDKHLAVCVHRARVRLRQLLVAHAP